MGAPASDVVAHGAFEVHRPPVGRQVFADCRRSIDEVRSPRKHPRRTLGRRPRPENRLRSRGIRQVVVARSRRRPQIVLLPIVRQHVPICIEPTGRQLKRRPFGNRQAIRSGLNRRHGIARRGRHRTRVAIAIDREIDHLVDRVDVEMVVRIALQVGRANACVAHDGARAAGLVSRGGGAVAAVVLGVVGAKLVPHLMRHIIDVERISDWRAAAGHPPSLPAPTRRIQLGNPPAASRKDMADVVIGRSDDGVAGRLVLVEHRRPAVVRVRIGASV